MMTNRHFLLSGWVLITWVMCGLIVAETGLTIDPLTRLQQLGQGGESVAPVGGAIPLAVPDWITPNVQIVYRSSISTEPPANRHPNDPPAVTAAMGMQNHTISKVTDTFVLVSSTNFLQQGVDANRMDIIGASTHFLDAQQVVAGEAFFMHPDLLAQLQTNQGMEVQHGPFPFNNQSIEAVTITVRGHDVVVRQVYDAQTGLKLIDHRATGPLRRGETRNEMNRQTNELTQFVGIRRIEGPWQNQGWPQWVNNLQELEYRGQMIHSMQGITQHYPMQSKTTITHRGDGWVRGMTRTSIQFPPEFGQQPPNEADFGQATGTLGGNWMSPAALAAIEPGVVDRDPYTGTVITYQRSGQLGVFTAQATGGSKIITGYNLNDGVLQTVRFEQPAQFQAIELHLANRK